MTDDIVTRLRDKQTEFDNWLNDMEGKYSFGHDESIWSDAADEIEYLRSEMANVNDEYNKLWRKYEQALKDNSTLIHVCQDPEGRWVLNG